MTDFPFVFQPYDHQRKAWDLSKDREYFALLMDMGTGKTKVTIDNIAYLYLKGEIDTATIIAPKGVYRNWVEREIKKHMPESVEYRVGWWDAGGCAASRDSLATIRDKGKHLRIFVINIESISTDKGEHAVDWFLRQGRGFMVIDESITIKNHKADRTKVAYKLGLKAAYRRILCGDPYANSPLDIYGQADFLKRGAIGHKSFWTFRGQYAKLVDMTIKRRAPGAPEDEEPKARSFKRIVGFQNMEELQRAVAPFSFICKKEDCLDLPPKVYLEPREVEMTPKQWKVYREMKQQSLVVIERALGTGKPVQELSLEELNAAEGQFLLGNQTSSTALIALTQLLRLRQIACGYLATDDGGLERLCPAKNPRIEGLLEGIEEAAGQKVVIWADFKPAVLDIKAALVQKYGPKAVVTFDGDTSRADREYALTAFQDPRSGVDNFVGNPATGSMGIELFRAGVVFYYTNSFNNNHRVQSEDRTHRIGLDHSVSYQDLCVRGTVDEKTIGNQREKKSMSAMLRDGSWRTLFD